MNFDLNTKIPSPEEREAAANARRIAKGFGCPESEAWLKANLVNSRYLGGPHDGELVFDVHPELKARLFPEG